MVQIVNESWNRWFGRLTRDWDATETESHFNVQNICDRVVWTEHNGIGDESVLVSLHSAHHSCLVFGRLIVMDNSNAT
jgi:hypothetical protein